jgi:hypothetical protein
MASVIWVLNFGGFNFLLLAGECIAAVSTVVLAEEFASSWPSAPGVLNGVPAPGEKSQKHRWSKDNCDQTRR